MSIEDIYFTNWYNDKDFYMLEQMKPEFHKEYYCRTAWFARDEEVEKLQEENEKLLDIVKFFGSFVPTSKVQKGLDPTFYITGDYEEDMELDKKIKLVLSYLKER